MGRFLREINTAFFLCYFLIDEEKKRKEDVRGKIVCKFNSKN